MSATPELLSVIEEGNVGILSPHPDDHILHANILGSLSSLPVTTHELVFTRGRQGINFLKQTDPDFVRDGRRQLEGAASSQHMRIGTYEQHDGADGALQGNEQTMAKTIMRWVIEKDITTLLALMTEDHPDHTAAALAGRLAITELVHRNHLPRHTRQLELLAATQDPSSSVQEYTSIIPVHHSTNSLIRAYGAAVCNPSQFEVYALDASAHSPLYSHQIIRGGYVFELSSYQRLHQYPIDRDAHYGVWQSDAVLPVQRLSLANHEYAILD